jgi:hypothetical protein
MGMTRAPRAAFTPEAQSTFEQTMDEVWKELLADDTVSPATFDAGQMRARLARNLITFASSGWSSVQIKQLLLRTLRNESRRATGLTLERPAATHETRQVPQRS